MMPQKRITELKNKMSFAFNRDTPISALLLLIKMSTNDPTTFNDLCDCVVVRKHEEDKIKIKNNFIKKELELNKKKEREKN